MWLQNRSLPPSQHRPPTDSCLGAASTLNPTFRAILSVGQSPPPHLQWFSLHKGRNTPFCPQWTLFLCGLLYLSTPRWPVDSSILWNSFSPMSTDSVDSSVRTTPHAVAGSRCLEYFSQAHPGNIPQHLLPPSRGASCQWGLGSVTQRPHPCPCPSAQG